MNLFLQLNVNLLVDIKGYIEMMVVAVNLQGAENLESLVVIDQSPIGRTPRSNPATYLGIFDEIRKLFAALPESNARGYKVGRFSFNVAAGSCFECRGDGVIKVEMHFLPEVIMTCKACNGKRYNSETLEITYKGKSIADVLDMTAYEALQFFAHHKTIAKRLQLLCDVGLDYLALGNHQQHYLVVKRNVLNWLMNLQSVNNIRCIFWMLLQGVVPEGANGRQGLADTRGDSILDLVIRDIGQQVFNAGVDPLTQPLRSRDTRKVQLAGQRELRHRGRFGTRIHWPVIKLSDLPAQCQGIANSCRHSSSRTLRISHGPPSRNERIMPYNRISAFRLGRGKERGRFIGHGRC